MPPVMVPFQNRIALAFGCARTWADRIMMVPMPEPVEICPVEEAIGVIGGKWKLLVLRSLLLNGPQRYKELLGTVTAISEKELTRNLRELVEVDLVAKASSDGDDARVVRYSLTELGQGLMPMYQQMLTWGQALLKARAQGGQ